MGRVIDPQAHVRNFWSRLVGFSFYHVCYVVTGRAMYGEWQDSIQVNKIQVYIE